MPKIDFKTAATVAVGVALFGFAVWGIRKLPSNAVTKPVKDVAAAATGG